MNSAEKRQLRDLRLFPLLKWTLCVIAAVAGTVVASSALARHRGHVGIGFHFGAPAYYGPRWYYPPPYYYYRPALIVPASPPVYIEQGTAEQPGYSGTPPTYSGAPPAPPEAQPANPAPPSQSYWYYCADTQAYYPYVKQCPGGWQRVSPQPPPG